jgi:hypothetical protein
MGVQDGVGQLDHVLVAVVGGAGHQVLGVDGGGGRSRLGFGGGVGDGDGGARGPGRGQGCRPQRLGQGGQQLDHRVRRGGDVDEQDRAAVAVGGVLPGTRFDQAGQCFRHLRGRGRGAERRQCRGPGGQVGQPGEPVPHLPALLRQPGQFGQCLGGVERPGRGGEAGHEDRAGGPVAHCVGDLVDCLRRGVAGQDRADRVAGPDQAVGRAGSDSGQQARPPGGHYLRPRFGAHSPAEERDPVADAVQLAHRLAPVVLGDRVVLTGQVHQARDVPVQPGADLRAVAAPGQYLDGHWAVVAQAVVAAPLRPPLVQPDVRLVEHITGHEILPSAEPPRSRKSRTGVSW